MRRLLNKVCWEIKGPLILFFKGSKNAAFFLRSFAIIKDVNKLANFTRNGSGSSSGNFLTPENSTVQRIL